MLKSLTELATHIFDFLLPPRTNFAIVQKLDAKAYFSLPEAEHVDNIFSHSELRSATRADWIHPLFAYRDKRVKAVIWELKYRENTLPLEHIGKFLYEEIIALMSDIVLFDSDAQFLLIPIPISAERRTERGYNQSEWVSKAVLENDTEHALLYAPQWFEKVKDTPRQSHSESKQERMQNLVGCFSADPRVSEKYIILIDDVVTTGSTLSEARHTLLSSGARDVFAFTIAH